MMNTTTVKHFDAATAPACPFTGLRKAGWYWRLDGDSEDDWMGPAAGGEAAARAHAAQGMRAR